MWHRRTRRQTRPSASPNNDRSDREKLTAPESLLHQTLKIRVHNIYAPLLAPGVETLQKLTRRQVDALQSIAGRETPERGVSLNAIADALRVRPPSALGHLTSLEELGLVARYRGKTRLSPKGRNTLSEYQRHHRIAESLFSQLGLSQNDVCAAAREVDLAMSHKTIERVCEAERHPSVCPHGEPIAPCATEKRAA
jgi:Mn-dependent DtxR family transcriptional regulator